MNLLDYVRRLFVKQNKNQRLEYIKEYAPERVYRSEDALEGQAPSVALKPMQAPTAIHDVPSIAFSAQGDLEAYVEGLNVSSEVIEGWISAGVLLPEETRVAVQMIRLMQQKGRSDAN